MINRRVGWINGVFILDVERRRCHHVGAHALICAFLDQFQRNLNAASLLNDCCDV